MDGVPLRVFEKFPVCYCIACISRNFFSKATKFLHNDGCILCTQGVFQEKESVLHWGRTLQALCNVKYVKIHRYCIHFYINANMRFTHRQTDRHTHTQWTHALQIHSLREISNYFQLSFVPEQMAIAFWKAADKWLSSGFNVNWCRFGNDRNWYLMF